MKATGENPDAILYEPVTKRIFTFNGRGKNATAIDAATLAVAGTLAPCEEPTGLAYDPTSKRLFAACSGNKLLAVVSAADGKMLGTVPIGEGCDATAFDPVSGLVYASNGDGTLTVVKEAPPGTYSAVESVATRRGARTMALDPAKDRVYLPAAQYGPPPAPSAATPRPRPPLLPGSFEVLVVGRP